MRCEVCESFRPKAVHGQGYMVREVMFDVRAVRLCGAHAKIAERSGVKSFDELRDLYGDDQKRSYVPRRASERPGSGRRQTDKT